ncbi:profilin-1, partial [Cyprinodon tularosa]|uniref:profilin-1 n=1 Tax=Cyprinodon tularosa TaxID=77115 RepID=UPI0018E286EA
HRSPSFSIILHRSPSILHHSPSILHRSPSFSIVLHLREVCSSRGLGIWSVLLLTAFSLSPCQTEEIKKLGSSDRSSFAQNGVYIGGTRCRLIRDQMDMDPVYALDLKTAADAEGNTFNVCVGKSVTAIVIVKGTKDASGGQLSSKAFSVVSYLRKSNM